MSPASVAKQPVHELIRNGLSRHELAILLIILMASFLLRVRGTWHAEVSQYDEGVYSWSADALKNGNRPYPGVFRQSPPLFYISTALLSKVTGLSAHRAGVYISVLAGTCTVLAVWLCARLWFGAMAGIIASALLGFSEFHIRFSRQGMTDVLFALLLLLTLMSAHRMLVESRWKWAVLTGILAGLAWETKVNGWFALLIIGFAICAQALQTRDFRTAGKLLPRFGLTVLIAGAIYVPAFVLIVKSTGGLSTYIWLMRLFISDDYFGGIATYMEMVRRSEGALSAAAPLIAIALAGLASRKAISRVLIAGLLVLALVSAIAGWFAVIFVAGIAGMILVCTSRPGVPAWLLTGWILFWMFSAPLYRPYARLLLPLAVALCIAAGAGFSYALNRPERVHSSFSLAPVAAALAFAVAWAGYGGFPHSQWPGERSPWLYPTEAPDYSLAIAKIVPRGARLVIVEEPPITYYLRLQHVLYEFLLDTIQPSGEQYVVASEYSRRIAYQKDLLSKLGPRLHEVASWPYTLTNPHGNLTLYRVAPE